MKKLTRKEALKHHINLWNWLTENPEKYKENYHFFLENDVKHNCFACEYSKQNGSFHCNDDCIIPIFAEQETCADDDSVFSLWCDALSDGDKKSRNRAKYAKIIADSGREALKALNKEVK